MNKWMVAPSYANAEIVKVDETTKKAYIRETCDRCGGRGYYAIGMCNNQPVLSPHDGGVCYECSGKGTISKWVKAYTESEYNSYIKATERRKARSAEIAEQKRQEELNKREEKRIEWMRAQGYDVTNPVVHIVAGGNTYDIKDELKAAGCRFDRALGWYSTHEISVRAPYFLVSFAFDEIFTWGFNYPEVKSEAYDKVKAKIEASYPESDSEWIGEEKERLRDMHVTVSAIRTSEGFYGTTFIYTFMKGKDCLVWMSSSCKDIEVGDQILLTGTVKKFDTFRGTKQTYLSRCIIKKEED